jgi:hypothetical protein
MSPNVKAISVAQAPKLSAWSPLTITIKSGKLRASRVGRRVVIKLVDLNKYLADNEVRS